MADPLPSTFPPLDVEQSFTLRSHPKQKGGWRAIKYILANESFEKLASMSLVFNITVYLQSKYNLGGVFVVNVVNIWSGCSNITSIAGAVLSDVFIGKFLTLLFGSIASFLGMGVITLASGIPELRPPPCHESTDCAQPHPWQLGILFLGLGLLAIGAGGIRPCNIAFGADQFDTSTEKGRRQLASFFNWWYFSFTIALVVALLVVVYIQTNISWVIGFSIPTACLAASIALFLIGQHTYIFSNPEGSIFIDMAKVIVASCRKRKLPVSGNLYYSLFDTPGKGKAKLLRTDRFKFLDKAALIANPSTELDCEGKVKFSWNLSNVQKVEQLKCLIAILPVWVSGIFGFVSTESKRTFGMLQLIQMKRSIGHFEIPPGWMNLVPMITLSIWIFIYESILIPKYKIRLTMRQRIQTGILMSFLCMSVSGIVEKNRRDSAVKHGTFAAPITMALLIPQFVFAGLTEAFGAVALLELFTTQMPESMRTVAGAAFFLSLSVANYVSALIVVIVQGVTVKVGKTPWLGGHDLNKNKLDYFYYTIAVLDALNLIYFRFWASRFLINKKVAEIERRTDVESNNTIDDGATDAERGIGES